MTLEPFDAALAEAATDALATAGHVRSLRVAAALSDELAAAGEAARSAGLDLGECAATAATVRIALPAGTNGQASDELQVDMDDDGRVSWRSARYGQLTVDGRMQLDLVAALDERGGLRADRPRRRDDLMTTWRSRRAEQPAAVFAPIQARRRSGH